MACVRTINPATIGDPEPMGYAHVSVVDTPSRMIYTAGQIGIDSSGYTPPSLDGQCKIVLQNIRECLKAAGASLRNVVKINIYVVNYDHEDHTILNQLREFSTDSQGYHFVPSTLVPVPCLAAPGLLIEIDVVAAVPYHSVAESTPSPTATSVEVDVIVVGGGLSGLQAAYDVQSNGLTCRVLEARNRVGGKTYSKPSGKGITESGAGWINDTTQPKIYALMQKFGIEPIVQQTAGLEMFAESSGAIHRIPQNGGQGPILDRDDGAFTRMCEIIDAEALKVDIYNIKPGGVDFIDSSLTKWLADRGFEDGVAVDVLRNFVRALLGVEPEELSAHYFLDYVKSGIGMASLCSDNEGGAQYMRVRQGTQSISLGLAKCLGPGSVLLNTPVQGIQQLGKSECLVTAAGGATFKCRKVIVSVPTPLYRAISFTPPLPPAKREYSESTFLGDYAKISFTYTDPWWRSLGLSASFNDLNGLVSFSRDTSSDEDDQFSITCFVVGETCRKWSKLATTERRDAVLKNVSVLIGNAAAEKLLHGYIEARESSWMPEIWSQGAPCPVPGPGVWERLGPALRTPFENIHFAGTETAFLWKGYMEGAVTSGERGAREVIKALQEKGRL